MKEKEALMALNAVPGLSARRIRQLTDYFGSAVDVLSSGTEKIKASGLIPRPVCRLLARFDPERFLDKEYRHMEKHHVTVMALSDPAYPVNLKEIIDAPVVLYVKGALHPQDALSLALVGSRRSSVYGMSVAGELAGQLAEMGFAIVSGMARGIDTASHLGALRSRGRTIAVLGCGLAQCYPAENQALMERIADRGAVVSEFFMTAPPKAQHFPQRNRIISGLSLGVVVVEAARQSGALITSRFAMEQGREVFALPGRIHDPHAAGTHRLIQDGAKLTTGLEDILEELQPRIRSLIGATKLAPAPPARATDSASASRDEEDILKCLGQEPVFIDDLVAGCRRPARRVLDTLLQMEMKHLIKRRPGMLYQRAG